MMLNTFLGACCPFLCLLWKVFIQVFWLFFNWFVFLILSCLSYLCILHTINLLSDIYHLQIFSLIYYVVFHFVGGFLHCAKTFKFKVPFVYFCFCFSCLRRQIQKNSAKTYIKDCTAYACI